MFSKKPFKQFYEIERIIGKRINKGTEQYLIKWKGYEISQSSWENAQAFNLCPFFLEDFEKSIQGVSLPYVQDEYNSCLEDANLLVKMGKCGPQKRKQKQAKTKQKRILAVSDINKNKSAIQTNQPQVSLSLSEINQEEGEYMSQSIDQQIVEAIKQEEASKNKYQNQKSTFDNQFLEQRVLKNTSKVSKRESFLKRIYEKDSQQNCLQSYDNYEQLKKKLHITHTTQEKIMIPNKMHHLSINHQNMNESNNSSSQSPIEVLGRFEPRYENIKRQDGSRQVRWQTRSLKETISQIKYQSRVQGKLLFDRQNLYRVRFFDKTQRFMRTSEIKAQHLDEFIKFLQSQIAK